MKSLRVKRITLTAAGSVPALVAVNGIVLAQVLGWKGLAVGISLVFLCCLLVAFATLLDILSRSDQNLSILRSSGASKASLASVLLISILSFGVAGAAMGAAAGAILAWSIGQTVNSSILSDSLFVIAASAVAIASGAYAGIGAAWKR